MNDEIINFKDIFKSSYLENISQFSFLDTLLALGTSFIIGIFIYFVYKKSFKGVMYSQGYGITLVAITVITTVIILAVTTNIVLSLGMVGALSIIRFRTAIKEPLDIAFMFWAISIGIVTGAGLIPLAFLSSLFICMIMLLFTRKVGHEKPYILILNCETDESESQVLNYMKDYVRKSIIKSKSISPNNIELTIECRLKNTSTHFINELSKIKGVINAVLVSYNGEYMS